MNSNTQSLVLLHVSIILFGGTALFARLIPLSALDITVYRSILASATLFFVLLACRNKIRLASSKDYWIVVLLGVLMGIHWVTYFLSMQLATVAVGIIAFFTYPIMTIFLEPLINKTKLKFHDIVSGFVVVIGIFFLIPEVNLENDATLGILSALFSAFLFTLRNILHKRHFVQYSGTQAMFYQTLIASLALFCFIDVPPHELGNENIVLVLIAGVIFTAAPHALFAGALRAISAKTVSLIACLQPLYATLLAVLILKESPNWQTMVGGLLIVSTAIFETIAAFDQTTETKPEDTAKA